MKLGKHSLLMMAGCGLMVVGIVVLPLLGVKLGGVLPLLFVLACPLSMVLMMGSMSKGHDHSGHGAEGSEEGHGAHCHEETAPRAGLEPRALPAPRERE
jgi:hypothetical protein